VEGSHKAPKFGGRRRRSERNDFFVPNFAVRLIKIHDKQTVSPAVLLADRTSFYLLTRV
jgi:hypothetical protein